MLQGDLSLCLRFVKLRAVKEALEEALNVTKNIAVNP